MKYLEIFRKGIKHLVFYDDEDINVINQYMWFIDQDGYAVGYKKDCQRKNKKWIKTINNTWKNNSLK